MSARFPMRALFVAVSVLAVVPVRAQQAAKIIDQCVKAQGGGARLSKVRTVSLEGSLTRVSDGKSGTFTLDTKFPNRYYLELVVGEQPEILAYNGKSAWQMSGNGEATTLLEQDAVQMEAAAFLANSHLLDLHKNKVGVAFVGPAKVGSSAATQLELTMPTGVKRELFFDVGSHLLRKESWTIAGKAFEITYDDY